MGEVFASRYELVDPIGRGGAGAVWRAWDHRRRRYVAAKVLQQSDAHALLRFVREQAMRIDHPHVLAPASWAADDDQVLFTMELVHGGSLSHLIGDYGPLPPRLVCVLVDQLLSGLTAVHAEGIIHRDIKPANILLEATGTGTPHVRLSDFGIAMRKGEPRLTETNFVVGTPGYFAPEQMLGADPDVPADLYAVGLVALYLLSGQKPDSQAIAERFLTAGTPPAPVGVPEPLWQVIGALLQPDPRTRFRTATGARKALAAAVELLPEPAPGDEPVEIFDQIGPLPEGFGPGGPEGARIPSAHSAPPTPSAALSPQGGPLSAPTQPGTRSTYGLGGPAAPPSTPAPSAQAPAAPPPPAHPAPVTAAAPPPPAHPAPVSAATPPPQPAAPPLPYVSPDTGYQLAQPQRAQEPSTATPPAHHPAYPPTRAETPPAQPLPEPAPVDRHQAVPVGAAAPGAPGTTGTPAPAPGRRPKPGPPAGVVIPVLVLAAICFAVGIVALAAS